MSDRCSVLSSHENLSSVFLQYSQLREKTRELLDCTNEFTALESYSFQNELRTGWFQAPLTFANDARRLARFQREAKDRRR